MRWKVVLVGGLADAGVVNGAARVRPWGDESLFILYFISKSHDRDIVGIFVWEAFSSSAAGGACFLCPSTFNFYC